jgi:hypothetical protein
VPPRKHKDCSPSSCIVSRPLSSSGNFPCLNSTISEYRKTADQTIAARREHRSPSYRSTLSRQRLKHIISDLHHIAAVLIKILPEIVIVDKMPPIESSDDRSADHKREIKIPQRWYCAEDPDELEYSAAFGRNALGNPPYCKEGWQGKEDWKPRQREGEDGNHD